MSGPEETIGGTVAPLQKSMRGGGGGAPAKYMLIYEQSKYISTIKRKV